MCVACRHCGILYIKNDCSFKLEPVKLKSVRPMVIDSVCLADTGINPQDGDKVEKYLKNKVEVLIEDACKESENDKLPLVRLKVREAEKDPIILTSWLEK